MLSRRGCALTSALRTSVATSISFETSYYISTEALRHRRGPQPHMRPEKAPTTARFDDTYLLSDQVKRLLKHNNVEEATRLLAKNSRLESTVAWNYLLDHLLRQGAVNQAMHTFNDMKRNRAFPSEITYTLMLQGFAENYESGGRDRLRPLLTTLIEDSRVKPNVIHLNAALKTATMSKDLTAAGEYMTMMQDAGVTDFDSRTYTTLLLIYLRLIQDADKRSSTTVRHFNSKATDQKAGGKVRKGQANDADAQAEVLALIRDTKGIWEDVLSLARRAKLEIDDQLLSRYCYILVRGSRADSVTVVDLISHFCGLGSSDARSSKTLPGFDLKMPLDLNLLTPYWQAICQLGDIDQVKASWAQINQVVPAKTMTRPFYDVILTKLYGFSERTLVMEIIKQMEQNKVKFNERTVWLAGRACSYYTSKTQANVTLKFYSDMADRFGREAVLSGINVMLMIEMLGKVDPRDGQAKEYQRVDGVLRIIEGWDWVDNAKMMLEHRKLDLATKLAERRDELAKMTRKLLRRVRDQDSQATFVRNRAQAVLEQIDEAKANWPEASSAGRTTQPRDFEGRDKYGNRIRR